MRAFVLSGGANLGPIQVGALRALLEHKIIPQMVVGCSAGALNAGYFAHEISLAQVAHLANVWRDVTTRDIYPEHRVGALWRLFSGQDSFYSNRNFYAFLQRHGATPAQTFGQATVVPLYITATHLHTGQLHVFGDDPNDRILDAMMASSALPPLFPPWEVDGERYIDGGTVTPLPLRVALERGATEIYSLHITAGAAEKNPNVYHGVASLLTRSVDTMLGLQAQHDLLLIKHQRKVRLHYLQLKVLNPPAPTDFTQAEQLMELGYAQTMEFLTLLSPQPPPRPTPQRTLRLSPANFLLRIRHATQSQQGKALSAMHNQPWLHRFWTPKSHLSGPSLPQAQE